MHGYKKAFDTLLNAEVDSMGGVYDGGISIGTKNSPRQVAIERAQAELRLEYDVREERRRELEFLERGGNPLDFRFGPPTSASVQSTSLADHLLENEEKGSFAEATSPQGDSVESSGRPGTRSIRESNIADNLLLLDGVHSTFREEKSGVRSKRKKNSLLDQTAKRDLSHNTKDSEESSILRLSAKGHAYARRNRSKSSRDNARVSTTDLTTPTSRTPILASSQLNTDQPIISSTGAQIDNHDSTVYIQKPSISCENDTANVLASDNHLPSDVEVPVSRSSELHANMVEVHESGACVSAFEMPTVNGKNKISQAGRVQSPLATITVAEKKVFREKDNSKSGGTNGLENSSNKTAFPNESETNGVCTVQPGTDTSARSSSGSEPSQIRAHSTVDVSNFKSLPKVLSDENNVIKEQNSANGRAVIPGMVAANENGDINAVDSCFVEKVDFCSAPLHVSNTQTTQSPLQNGDSYDARSNLHSASQYEISNSNRIEKGPVCPVEKRFDSSASHASGVHRKATCNETMKEEKVISSIHESSDSPLPKRSSSTASDVKVNEGNDLKMARKSFEDAILTDAQIIEAKHRRAKEPPAYHFILEKHQKSHWDYVLEEMAWLANDFMQERLWKITAAAQICYNVAATVRSILENKDISLMHRKIARSLAESVKGFWQYAEKNTGLCEEDLVCHIRLPVQRYAVRLLQSDLYTPAEAPKTPDRISDGGTMSWKEHNLGEILFYKVPFDAMRAYRESVQTYCLHHEEIDSNMQQVDCEASVGDSGTDIKNHGNTLEDDEDETAIYYLPKAFETNKILNSSPMKMGLQKKSGVYKAQGTSFDVPYASGLENKSGSQILFGKRPASINVGSVPTKRFRSATRQRLGSFGANAAGVVQMFSKTDASSGDTSSFQDDEVSLQGLSQRRNAEVESTMDSEKQVPFDGTEVSIKPKKKKTKYLGCKSPFNSTDCGGSASLGKGSYDRKWPMDSLSQLDQVDLSKRKLEGQQFEASGPGGPFTQHSQKKPKILKQFSETSQELVTPITRPVPSPVASQMSNMSNSSRLNKVIQGRDRGKKNKTHKGASGQSGSGSAWSQFEDQALVVLVHDMGPNWELVSDAINSTLQFKCIFRKPKECKERHKVLLMDKNAGDGADSAEDSGSSQHYPSTLPGIPKGSARQLFQRLQGPLEEDTVKAHFEKIIAIGRRLQPRRNQKENQDSKQTNPVHCSHFQALSQACPNNLSGGPLTPLDLCDAIVPSPDSLLHVHQGPHNNGIGLPNQQGSLASPLPTSGTNSLLQGSPGMIMGSSFPSPSGPSNAPIRDAARFSIPRSTSLSSDDQQRMQYNTMLPNRTVSGAFSGGTERVRMLSSGNGVGMVCGVNLGMPAPRAGFQGISSPGVLNMVSSSNMLSSNGVGIPNIHHGSISAHGVSTMRSRESLQPRTFPVQQQQSHQISHGPQQPHMHGSPHHPHIHGSGYPSPQNQAFAVRMAKERQQRLIQQQSSSGSAAVQNSPQAQQPNQPSSPLPSISPSHSQHKQPSATQNPQNSAPLSSQMIKQRQRQQLQQQPRQQTQQQQPAQQQAKLMKGAGRGVLMHQNLPVDASYMNGPSPSPGNQILEKQIMQRQTFYPGTSGVPGSNTPLSQVGQQKMYRGPPQSTKGLPIISQGDSPNPVQAQVPPDQYVAVSQPPSASSQSSQTQQQRQSIQPHPTMHRVVLQQNRQLADSSMPSMIELAQPSQMRSTTAVPLPTDSANASPDVTSGALSSHWKQERSFEANAPAASTAHMASSPQSSLVGMDSLVNSSGQGLMQRQFPGGFSVHGHGNSSSWQQQQQQQLQSQQQSTPLTHQQHRHSVQGSLYGRQSPNP